MYSMQRLPDRSSADAPHAAGALGTGAQMSESCSSRGLTLPVGGIMRARRGALHASRPARIPVSLVLALAVAMSAAGGVTLPSSEIGRASCRGRVCQYV